MDFAGVIDTGVRMLSLGVIVQKILSDLQRILHILCQSVTLMTIGRELILIDDVETVTEFVNSAHFQHETFYVT